MEWLFANLMPNLIKILLRWYLSILSWVSLCETNTKVKIRKLSVLLLSKTFRVNLKSLFLQRFSQFQGWLNFHILQKFHFKVCILWNKYYNKYYKTRVRALNILFIFKLINYQLLYLNLTVHILLHITNQNYRQITFELSIQGAIWDKLKFNHC